MKIDNEPRLNYLYMKHRTYYNIMKKIINSIIQIEHF